MKTIIYGAIVAIFLLIGISFVLIYHTQDAKEKFNFKDSVNYDELEIETSYQGQTPYLTSAKGEIGKLSLTNNGFFRRFISCPVSSVA